MTQRIFEDLKSGNKSSLLRKRMISHLILNGNTTINDLSKVVDVSVPTATKIVDALCGQGILNVFGKMETNGGRYPYLYGLNPDAAYFVGVDIKNSGVNIGIINFNGQMIASDMNIPYTFENSEEGLRNLCDVISHFINDSEVNKEKIFNIHVNVSGRVNPDSGYSYSWFNLGESPLASTMQEILGYNVTLDNDTRAMTYAEFVKSRDNNDNVLFVNLSWGLGMGIIIDGKVYSGRSGFAGEFGHTPAFDNEVICHCGKKGCLETEASGRAMHRILGERIKAGENSILSEQYIKDPQSVTLENMVDAVNNDDTLCIDIVEEIGAKLGKSIAGLINVLNPDTVIIGGIMSVTGDYLLQPIKTSVRKHSLSIVNKDTKIVLSTLQGKAGLVGACMLARYRAFDFIGE